MAEKTYALSTQAPRQLDIFLQNENKSKVSFVDKVDVADEEFKTPTTEKRQSERRLTGWMVTRLAWMAARLVSSKSETRYASADSWSAPIADDWKRRSVLKSCAISRTRRWKLSHGSAGVGRVRGEDGRELADEELSRLLVATDLAEGDRSGLVAVRRRSQYARDKPTTRTGNEPVRLLDTTSLGRTLARGLGGELLAGGLASGGLAGGLLCAPSSREGGREEERGSVGSCLGEGVA